MKPVGWGIFRAQVATYPLCCCTMGRCAAAVPILTIPHLGGGCCVLSRELRRRWNAANEALRIEIRATSSCPDAKGAEPLAALIRSESRELAICQQLANGAKHFIRTRHNDPNVSSQRLKSVSIFVSKDGQEQHVIPSHGIFVEDGVGCTPTLGFLVAHELYSQSFSPSF
jgi:hypothetical protein